MSLPFSQLFETVSADSIMETLLSVSEAEGLPSRSWRAGSTTRVFYRVTATLMAGFLNNTALLARSNFLDYAEGKWLTQLAALWYGVERPQASFASGNVTIDNLGGGAFPALEPGDIRVYNPTTSQTYVSTALVSIAPNQLGVVVPIQCIEAGSLGSSLPASITAFETTLVGCMVSNPLAIVGSDELQDEALRRLCRDSLAARSPNGPRGAYRYFAQIAKLPSGAPANINRITISKNSSFGIVNIYIASPSGTPTAADTLAVQDSVENNCRADTDTVNVVPAAVLAIALPQITIWAKKEQGATQGAVLASAQAALVDLQKSYPIGGIKKGASLSGKLYGDAITRAIMNSSSSVYDVDWSSVDYALAVDQVPVLTYPSISVNIVEVST